MEHRQYSSSRTQPCLKCNLSFSSDVLVRDHAVIQSEPLCRSCWFEVKSEAVIWDGYRKQRAELDMAKVSESQRHTWWQSLSPSQRLADQRLDAFEKNLQPRAFEIVSQYNWRVGEDGSIPKSIVLMSPNIFGVGKTHLVYALARKIIETEPPCSLGKEFGIQFHPLPVCVMTEPDLLGRIRATFSEGASESEDAILKELNGYRLLVIDDVGKLRPKDLNFLQGIYYRIIDGRYVADKPIVLTTNLDPKQFESHIGGACADRLIEMCGTNFVKMTGKSYRREHGIGK